MTYLTELIQLAIKIKSAVPKKVKGRLIAQALEDYSAAPYEFVELVQSLEWELECLIFNETVDPGDVEKMQKMLFDAGFTTLYKQGRRFRINITASTYVLVEDPFPVSV